jgi:Ser/Thr protein kinase RdoA (MazF antagonist)
VTPSTDELRAALGGERVEELEREPYPYSSSHPLELLRVTLARGERLDLIFKDLSPGALLKDARDVKPGFLLDPQREIDVYRRLRADSWPAGPPRCHGAVVDEKAGRYWLFLEVIEGHGLYEVGDIGVWEDVARSVAGLHRSLAALASPHLLRLDRDYYRIWPRRALRFAGPEATRGLEPVVAGYETAVDHLVSFPAVPIHGELYASNVLVAETDGRRRVCVVDWEMAAVGPALVDLAALVAGGWTEEERRRLSLAYRSELGQHAAAEEDFLADLDRCRLHLAFQWLGWSPSWIPPVPHRRDWLAEALYLGEKLGL